jgi:hypothetical protein
VTRTAALAVAALVLLLLASVLLQPDGRRWSATSFGTVAGGHRALFELLGELGLAVERSYQPPDMLRDRATVWWVEPWLDCEGPELEGLADFARRGGTAVLFLAARPGLYAPDFTLECPVLGGVTLPPRRLPYDPEDPEAGIAPEEPELQHVRGDGGYLRTLHVPPLAVFEGLDAEWHARLGLRDRPFVIESRLGEGRIVAVADGTFLRNAWLDGGDAALLAFDVVRTYGTPAIDEHAHRMRLSQSAAVLLSRLGALPVFLGLLALAGLVLWRRAAVPAGLPEPPPGVRPALDEFVASLAALYARSRDWPRLADHYRRFAVDRIRAHFGLPPETPLESLAARLREQGRASAEGVALLLPDAPVRGQAEWLARVRALDRLVEEVCR